MVNIITNFSNMGGSTESLIDVTNEFNKVGIETTFYGPHKYHLDKCRSGTPDEISIDENDICICHYLKLRKRPKCKMVVLTSHETDVFPLNQVYLYPFDKIRFVSEHQAKWHNVDFPHFVLGNFPPKLKKGSKVTGKVGGIVGTIMENKQTHKAIQWALDDGCEIVNVYGNIGEVGYYDQEVSKFLADGKVNIVGWITDRQKIYNDCTDIYTMSKSETFCKPKLECELTKRTFHCPADANYAKMRYVKNTDTIMATWIKELEI